MEQKSTNDEQFGTKTNATSDEYVAVPNKKQNQAGKDDDGSVQIDIAEVFSNALNDLVKEHCERANQAEVLLGGCLDMVCTYPEGYKNRQPLYSCKTCAEISGQLAGICYGCSENCHDGHELVELYTKRNFCCDCGNSKFSQPCKLFEGKDPLNVRNSYNDNFKGNFCVCKKPYPPPELESGDEIEEVEDMFQCCICEDWFHPLHIFDDSYEKSKLDDEQDEHFELVCQQCLKNNLWLTHYQKMGQKENKEETKEDAQQQDMINDDECKLKKMEFTNKQEELKSAGMWFPSGWRERLCRCRMCMILYENSKYLFLLDDEDTIESYEQRGRELVKKNMENKQDFLQPEFAIKVTSGIEQMKQHCVEFFAKRTAEKRGADESITEGDVAECFQELKAKRQRLLEQEEVHNAPWTQ